MTEKRKSIFDVPKGMTLREYLLKQGKSVVESATLPIKLRKDKHGVRGWIIKKEDEVSNLNIKIANLKGADKLDIDEILDGVYALEILEGKINDGKELYFELFGEEYTD